MKFLFLLSLLASSAFANTFFLDHLKSPSPLKHVMKMSHRFAVIETSDYCFIEKGTGVTLRTYGDIGTLRFRNSEGVLKECHTTSASLMKATKAQVTYSELNERFILKTANTKQYQVSKLSDCDFLHNYEEVLIIIEYRPNDFSTIIKAGNELCLEPSLRLIK